MLKEKKNTNPQTAKLSKWGNSQAVRIPKDILRQLGIDENGTVSMVIDDDKLIIQKQKKESKLMNRFQNYDYVKYLDSEDRVFEKGKATGREIW
ncbi:AbrB/MazE/SpoVT family DNA-binding domain-containing protein [Paucilactobacillus sp. N302-9]